MTRFQTRSIFEDNPQVDKKRDKQERKILDTQVNQNFFPLVIATLKHLCSVILLMSVILFTSSIRRNIGQERAFWDVYRPPPGQLSTTELDIKKMLVNLINNLVIKR